MSVASALTLRGRREGRIRPDLDHVRSALEALGNPQRDFHSILVVGTNGKGSTAATLEAVLRAHGVKTGLYTSPHLVRVEERIRINGIEIGEPELAGHLAVLDAAPDLTYFEVMTVSAFGCFSANNVEVAVLEAGMGGSWDATRAAASQIAGLTNIGSDHQNWLGSDRSERARDKGRALAAAARAVLGAGVDEFDLAAIAAPRAVSADALVECAPLADDRLRLHFGGKETVVQLGVQGAFQRDNVQLAVALALCAVDAGWLRSLDQDLVRHAIEAFSWPGRLTTHRVDGREVLTDCSHNLEAATALAEHLQTLGRRYNLLFSCLDDKPVEEMAAVLRPVVGDVVVCSLDDERAMGFERLQAAFGGCRTAPDPLDGLEILDDPVLAAGSIRLVGRLIGASEGVD